MIAFKVFLLISLLTILEGAGVPRITPVMHKHPHGHSINVLKFNDDETLRVDYEAFNELFMHSDVKDRNIAAVSIIGAFRKGKSFFMDYCLRFMYANVSENRYVMTWIQVYLNSLVQISELHVKPIEQQGRLDGKARRSLDWIFVEGWVSS